MSTYFIIYTFYEIVYIYHRGDDMTTVNEQLLDLIKENHLTYKKVQIKDHTVSYFETGEQHKDTLLLIHGFGATAIDFLPIIKHILELHIVAIDLPGRGDSTMDERIYTPAEIATWLHNFVTKVGLKKFHIAAHSIAAHYMFEYASKHDVISCISLDGGYMTPKHVEGYSLEQEIEQTKALVDMLAYDTEADYFAEEESIGKTLEEALIDRRLFVTKGDGLEYTLSPDMAANFVIGAKDYPNPKVLKKVKQDVLILRSDLPEEINDFRATEIKDFTDIKPATVMIVNDSTHSVYITQPEITATYIKNWIENQ